MERSLSKITIIYQATGLQYFSINTESLELTRGLSRKHKFFLTISFILLMGELYALFLLIHSQRQEIERNGVTASQIIQITVYSLGILGIAISMLNSLLLKVKSQEIFKNCKIISELLSVLNRSADYSDLENEFKKTIAKLLVSFTISNVAYLTFIYHYGGRNTFLTAIAAVYLYFFMTVVFSYWTLLVRLMRENLRFINKSLVHIHKKHKLFRLNGTERYSQDLRIRRNQETLNFIAKLKRTYALIYESTALVNEFIGIPISVFMALVVLSNISAGYRIFLWFVGEFPVARIVGACEMKNL